MRCRKFVGGVGGSKVRGRKKVASGGHTRAVVRSRARHVRSDSRVVDKSEVVVVGKSEYLFGQGGLSDMLMDM